MTLARAAFLVTTLLSASSLAQNLRVIIAPWSAADPTLPHPAYNGHATTFKAIARGGNGSYFYEWDYEGDGVYDSSASSSNRYNLSKRATLPTQTVTTTFQAKVRVTSAGQTVTATYPVRVFADVPANPASATDRQLQVMRNVALDDGLWFLHTQMLRTGSEEDPLTGAQITGTFSTPLQAGSYLEALGRTGHLAAFPDAYLGSMPDPIENSRRWRNDPYAEDAARLVNSLLTSATVVTVQAADESNLTGFYPEVTATPLAGTDDGVGLVIGNPADQNHGGYTTSALRGLATAGLRGYVAQTGDFTRVLGRPFEFVVQQLVDGVAWEQNDTGTSYPGSWGWFPNTNVDILGQFQGGTVEAIEALWTAEKWMGAAGVIVPNLVKARATDHIRQNSRACPGGGSGGAARTFFVNVCDFALTAAHVFQLGWVGANAASTTDDRAAFPGYSATTRGQLRTQYNSTLTFITNSFLTGSQSTSEGWDKAFVSGGNFGRVDGLGDLWSMLHWARAARAVTPAIVLFGVNDWDRLFSRYLISNQAVDGSFNWVLDSTGLGNNNDNVVGSIGRAAWALLVMSADGLSPVAMGSASATNFPEGTPINFTSVSDVPGASYLWSFGNGETLAGQNVTYAYPDNGNYNATITVTAAGRTTVDTIALTVTNVAPTADAGADFTVDEGQLARFSGGVSDPGTNDTFTYNWLFGDGSSSTTRSPTRLYADNGTYNASFRVTDDDLGTTVDPIIVTVRNVAPTITSLPSTAGTEGTPYTYVMTFVDPCALDTHTCSAATMPTGATLTGCRVNWTPTPVHALAPQAFELCVTDDDGGKTCQQFNVTIPLIDTDADSLPDTWETQRFGGLSAQAAGDPDGDGLTNAQELLAGTNPTSFDGPSTPTTQSPTCDGRLATPRPSLTVTNAIDPQATALTYDFELYADAALTSLVAGQRDVPAGTTTTTWQLPFLLQENGRYSWRARAKDATAYGPWTSPVCAFTVDVVDEPPSAPQLDLPVSGATVSSLTPTLSVRNALDPEGDPLTYDFEVLAGSTVVASAQAVAEGNGTTGFTLTTPLTAGQEFTWRARAQSANGPGPFSLYGRFVTAAAPVASTLGVPTIVAPQNGTVVDTLSPELSFLPAQGDRRFDWELASDVSFTTVVASGLDVSSTRLAVSPPLTEDALYCWRVRSTDGSATSSWAHACFTVSVTDGAPGVPTLMNPSNDSVVATLLPVFTWVAAVDPERDPVTYELELAKDGAVLATVQGIGGTAAVTPSPLEDGGQYSWRVRATTKTGASDFSGANAFSVLLPQLSAPEQPTKPTGCSCDSAPLSGALVALLLWGRRRRER